MSLNISADLVPLGAGAWPTHTDIWGKGGYRAVLDNASRDAITTLRRSEAMLVYVISSGNTYRLGPGLTNADWVLQSSGAITAGNGLTGTTSLSVQPNGSTLDVSASGVKVATGGITSNELANGSVDLAGAKVTGSLPGSRVTPDFVAQNVLTTGFVSIGANPAASGNIRLANDMKLTWRNAANSADLLGLTINSADGLILGNTVSTTVINGPTGALNGIRMLINGATVLNIGTSMQFLMNSVSFDSSQTAANFFQSDQTGASTNGKKFTLHAQNATGVTSTGGALDVAPGSGTTAGGLGRLLSGSAAARFGWNDTGWATDGVTPIAQPARVGQLTDGSGGTPSTTNIAAAAGAYSQSNENDFRATMATWMNKIENIVHNRGISA